MDRSLNADLVPPLPSPVEIVHAWNDCSGHAKSMKGIKITLMTL